MLSSQFSTLYIPKNEPALLISNQYILLFYVIIIILLFDYYLTATKLHLFFGLCDKHCINIKQLKLLIQLKFHRLKL